MQMLHAGGLPVIRDTDSWSYETDLVTRLPADSAWLADCRGKAVKLLDPHRWTPPPGLPYRFIWMQRNPKEQAKSQVKFLKRLQQEQQHNIHYPAIWPSQYMRLVTSRDVPNFRKQIQFDMRRCVSILESYRRPWLRVRFESVLKHPTLVADNVSRFCGGLDVEAMVTCVRKRPVHCVPGMLEYEQEEGGNKV